ncbi:MAG: DUF2851 family protein [Gracilimonas sp.]|uniref:DUF2851 family protein n=1 Tax=Gracilimonas sp. TaxID=1974203 RepID=UPI0019CBB70F|nr:DUF2851 family protein [Gracilimonas sp.]MBD3617822.1 DUF2851 family protein [Gracilimonas sp.]
MAEAEFQHSEAFLQWIWENLLFEFTSLKTNCGKPVRIIDPGKANATDGPDFRHAVIEIDGIKWHGDVEIHVKGSDWSAHHHQKDLNFNAVILHVVANEKSRPVSTENGSTPFTLNLLHYLPEKLRLFLRSFAYPSELPCVSGLSFISKDAFKRQIEKAHVEYFEKKSNDFLRFYDPELLPSKAWRQALILSCWDGLGISHNREAMRETAKRLLASWDGASIDQGISLAWDIAGLGASSSEISWNMKSVRPANHPKRRVYEAVKLSYQILNEPFQHLLSLESLDVWSDWMEEASLSKSSRMKILYGTVYLPSLYMLGNLYAHQRLCENVLSEWKRLKTPIPSSLLRKFNSLNLDTGIYRRKLGAVHQLKSYCKPVRCSECFVLKKAIES